MAEKDDDKKFVEELTDQSDDFSRWYTEVILKAQLADYAPVRGCMVIRPYGYAMWEHMTRLLDARIKETGHENAYFPLFIPESFLLKEAEHVEGFAPQVAWVTQGGTEQLPERLAIRPTSEAIIGYMYGRWVQSWRDLPILINQWANVVRWEKVTRLFLRTMEFLWQEGHTLHRTADEAQEETMKMLGVYTRFAEEDLAIPVMPGEKTPSERFAGADRTFSIEALMRDGKALQAGTSHNLGQGFAKAFDIDFQDMDGQRRFAWSTSWGVSTRLMGAIIMVHGDDAGLILPPKIAPVQVIIVPIWRKEPEREKVAEFIAEVQQNLPGIRLKVDWRDEYTPGYKFNDWEMRGVPIRLEVGPRDVANRAAVVVRRDTRTKEIVPLADLPAHLNALLPQIQQDLYQRALTFRQEHTHHATTMEEFEQRLTAERGFIEAFWCGSDACEAAIKTATTATIRCIPQDRVMETGACIYCGQPSIEGRVLFAKAY